MGKKKEKYVKALTFQLAAWEETTRTRVDLKVTEYAHRLLNPQHGLGRKGRCFALTDSCKAFAQQAGPKMSDKYNLKDYSSPYNFHLRNDQLVREYQISIENMSMVRQELSECVRTEGINHFVNCKELRQKYFELCNDKFRGMVMPPDSKPMNREVPGLIAPPAKN